jgi:flagellin-like hook-associated protein FlgL
MKLKFIVATLLIGAVPLYGQETPQTQKTQKAQKSRKNQKATEPTKAAPISKVTAAQNLVKTISRDNAKKQTYCDIGKLGGEIEQAGAKNDIKKIDELNKKTDELASKLGPEYVALMSELEDIDPSSKEAQDINSAFADLDKLCTK